MLLDCYYRTCHHICIVSHVNAHFIHGFHMKTTAKLFSFIESERKFTSYWYHGSWLINRKLHLLLELEKTENMNVVADLMHGYSFMRTTRR